MDAGTEDMTIRVSLIVNPNVVADNYTVVIKEVLANANGTRTEEVATIVKDEVENGTVSIIFTDTKPNTVYEISGYLTSNGSDSKPIINTVETGKKYHVLAK